MTKNNCERPPTNAEIVYKIFHEWLNFWKDFIKLIFKSKLLSFFFVISFSCGMLFFLAQLKFSDCIEGAKFILALF